MAAELLLDTGAFIALLDRDEKLHDDCVAALERWTGPVITTEAVLTETLYLVGPAWSAQKACLEFILRGAFQLVPSSTKSLQRVAVLMEKYRNVPMDFADATLTVLAEELETEWVFTWTGADLPPTGCTETELSRSSLSWNNYPFPFPCLALSASFTYLQTFKTQVAGDGQRYPAYPFGNCPATYNGLPAVNDPKQMK